MKVPVDKIGEVIGPKGKMINQIQDDTGAEISIEDDGTVYIGATDGPSADAARAMINAIANPQMPEVGERFLGTVVKTTTFGAFVSLLPGKDGLLHISEVRKLVGGKRIDIGRRRRQGRPEDPGRAQGDRPPRQAQPRRGDRRARRPTRPTRRLRPPRSRPTPDQVPFVPEPGTPDTGCAGLRRSRPGSGVPGQKSALTVFHPAPTCTRGRHAVVPLRG